MWERGGAWFGPWERRTRLGVPAAPTPHRPAPPGPTMCACAQPARRRHLDCRQGRALPGAICVHLTGPRARSRRVGAPVKRHRHRRRAGRRAPGRRLRCAARVHVLLLCSAVPRLLCHACPGSGAASRMNMPLTCPPIWRRAGGARGGGRRQGGLACHLRGPGRGGRRGHAVRPLGGAAVPQGQRRRHHLQLFMEPVQPALCLVL